MFNEEQNEVFEEIEVTEVNEELYETNEEETEGSLRNVDRRKSVNTLDSIITINGEFHKDETGEIVVFKGRKECLNFIEQHATSLVYSGDTKPKFYRILGIIEEIVPSFKVQL